jgi:hypothetical protein
MIDSGAHEDGRGNCHIRMYFGTVTLICELPRLVPDYCVRHVSLRRGTPQPSSASVATGTRSATPARVRCYSSSEGTLHAFTTGRRRTTASTTKSKCYLPSLGATGATFGAAIYDLTGRHFWTEPEGYRTAWEAVQAVESSRAQGPL